MMLPVQPSTVARSESSAQSRDISQILPSNAEQSARVVNVRQDPVSPTLFRVALEVGNNRLEVMTNRPLAQGLSVVLSRDGNGEVVLRIPVPATNQTQTGQAQALSQINSSSNQFIAMIAPESRAQAQQLLNQAQMTALVQPQVGNPSQPLSQPLSQIGTLQGALQNSLTSVPTNPPLQANNSASQTNTSTTQSSTATFSSSSSSSSSSATGSSNPSLATSAATSSQSAGNINTGGISVSTNSGSAQNPLAAQAAQNSPQTSSTTQTAPSATLTPASATQTPLNTGNALANNPTATGSTGTSVNANLGNLRLSPVL